MIRCVIDGGKAVAEGDFGTQVWFVVSSFEGRKSYAGQKLKFEATQHNLDILDRYYPEAEVINNDAKNDVFAAESETQIISRPEYQFKTKPYRHQSEANIHWGDKNCFGYFMDMGTGKSKALIDKAGSLWCENKIDAVLIVSPLGVHNQWVEDQVPNHLGDIVPRQTHAWDKKKLPPKIFNKEEMCWFTINIDALRTKSGYHAAYDFIKFFDGRVLMAIDESHAIKNYSAIRTRHCYALGDMCKYRAIMTGTPIAKDLTDEWSQFKFLDEKIVGTKYVTTFRREYCIMGGFENRQVIGHRNLEKFKSLTAPYCFRVTKDEELDLPPKVFDEHPFDMSPQQRKIIQSIKDNFSAQTDDGFVAVNNAITALLRIQQVTCGHYPDEDGNMVELKNNPRLDALQHVIESRSGKTVIWARFNHDIKVISDLIGPERSVKYYGGTSPKERKIAKELFLDPDSGIDYFISNPAAGGTGLNLQGHCRTVIYYSNSFKAIDRWQSEDRTHRMGMLFPVTYIDLICRGSPDRKIMANLRKKKSISELALSDLRGFVLKAN